MKKIIAFQGEIGSGKDTCAEIAAAILRLPQGRDVEGELPIDNPTTLLKKSFAGKAKEMISILTGIPMVEYKSPFYSESYYDFTREQKEKQIPIYNMSLGRLLQVFATDVCRDSFREDIWILGLDESLQENSISFITDMRFLNEFGYLEHINALKFRVVRSSNPFNKSDTRPRGHRSETSMSSVKDIEFNGVINNTSDLQHLFCEVENVLKLSGMLSNESNITEWEAEKIIKTIREKQ